MHYWFRSIKGGQFRLVNFASHFIPVQIFQIDFPLILSASKYFRYISLSFYICRGQNEHFSINSVRKTGRVELYKIFDLSDWCTDICGTKNDQRNSGWCMLRPWLNHFWQYLQYGINYQNYSICIGINAQNINWLSEN